MLDPIKIGDVSLGGGGPLFLIAGPCVIEDRDTTLETARFLKGLKEETGIPVVFKASYDKANRTSIGSFRGPGIKEGLDILGEVRETLGLPVLSDVHSVEQVGPAARVLDVLQIPAFLCRQTDLILAAAETGRAINLKKGQFVSPFEMEHAVQKILSTGNRRVLVTERGTCFGYNNLVVDMRSLTILSRLGCPVVFDATHSVQLPGGGGSASGGEREFAGPLARAAVACGADGIFMEVHPNPEAALCDGPNALPLDQVKPLVDLLIRLHRMVRS